MITLKDYDVKIPIFRTPNSTKERNYSKNIIHQLSQQQKKNRKSKLSLKYSLKRQSSERAHSEIKRRIMTAGGKRMFPKDFFDEKVIMNNRVQTQNIEIFNQDFLLNSKGLLKEQIDNCHEQLQTPKFKRSHQCEQVIPFDSQTLQLDQKQQKTKGFSRNSIAVTKNIKNIQKYKMKNQKIIRSQSNCTPFFPKLQKNSEKEKL